MDKRKNSGGGIHAVSVIDCCAASAAGSCHHLSDFNGMTADEGGMSGIDVHGSAQDFAVRPNIASRIRVHCSSLEKVLDSFSKS